MKEMDLFAGERHNGDEDLDTLPPVKSQSSETEMLDYMVLVLSRFMSCDIAFKGGYMLNQLLQGYSRMTHDVAFSIAKKDDYGAVKAVLKKIALKFMEQGLIASYKIKEDIAEKVSGGIDMYAADGHKVLGVDVGLHNISYGVRHYDLVFTSVDAFTVERMLADKLIAITTRKRFRRTKDLYDFYAITNFFDVDMQKLSQYVELRSGAEWDNIPFDDDVVVQYKRAWDKLELENYNGSNTIEKPGFMDAIKRFYQFSLPLKYGEAVNIWEHVNGRFI